jgi:hypothetical protein
VPNRSFNADANTGHAFGILLASVGTLRPYGLRRRLTLALGLPNMMQPAISLSQTYRSIYSAE